MCCTRKMPASGSAASHPSPFLQTEGQHMLAAMLSCKPSAQGGRYLQRMLAGEVMAQLRGRQGDAPAALAGALAALDQAFRNLHPFNGPVREGVRIAVALVDLKQQVPSLARPSWYREKDQSSVFTGVGA